MRVTLWEPQGELDAELVEGVLGLVIHDATLPDLGEIEMWTRLELLLAYDWAMREHLSASDNPTRRRSRPSFTIRRGLVVYPLEAEPEPGGPRPI